jgi:hypothetical protein
MVLVASGITPNRGFSDVGMECNGMRRSEKMEEKINDKKKNKMKEEKDRREKRNKSVKQDDVKQSNQIRYDII